MKFIAGGLNGEFLLDYTNRAVKHADTVFAAVAYASSDPILFQICRNKGMKLRFWGRYDVSVPIATPILKKFLDLKSSNYECRLVPDIFHPKVIWWKNYGVYVGSANLTERGWFGNIETGVFIDSIDIIENDIEGELNDFFEELDNRSFPLTTELYEELCALEKNQNHIDEMTADNEKKFQKTRIIPPVSPLTRFDKRPSVERKRNTFIKEWNNTLQLLRNISEKVSNDEYRPRWVEKDVQKGVQVDQFLHAFYYSKVRKGSRALHHEFHEENKKDSEQALVGAMRWWKSLEKPPHEEDRTIYEWAPYLNKKLNRDCILELEKDEFIEVCSKIHAMRDHSLRVKYTEFGLTSRLPSMDSAQRINYFSRWLYSRKSKKNRSVLETIHYVLHGGSSNKLSDRLWESVNSQEWFIPHLGISSLGEMAGWAMPDIFPPRNGRTSKALYALGNNVRIHSE